MTKALKVTMIIYASTGILFGMAFIFVPRQLGAMLGHESGPAYVAALTAELGVSFISACIFLIIATRDPIKHILWVKYSILFAILMLASSLYSFVMGNLTLNQAGIGIIHAVFAGALLAFYPWHGLRTNESVHS
jgi:hypothetical protein